MIGDYEFQWMTSLSEMERQIESEVIKALKKEFGVDVVLFKNKIKNGIQAIIRKHIERNPTFISVCKDEQGKLWAELGLPMDRRMWAANEMVDIIAQGVDMEFNIEGKNGLYELDAHVIWTNDKMQELINNGHAAYLSKNVQRKTSYQIPWLEWLLDGGSSTLVSGFHIVYGNFPKQKSRSGMAVMRPGGAWNMPFGDFTPQRNFITESLEEATPEILQFIMENMSE